MALSTTAKVYIGGVTCAGLSVFLGAAVAWTSADPLRFFAYLLLTGVASGMKVTLPGITGTMSVSYVFILLSVVQLSFPEAIFISVLSALVQCFWHAKERPRPIHLFFNTSFMAVTAALSYGAYHYSPVRHNMIFALGCAACAYFFSNTLAVAGVISVTENKPIATVWKNSYFWSFPYYLLGASLTASMNYLSRFLNWEVSLAILPMVFIIYRSYGLYLRQLEEQTRHAEDTASLHLRTIEALALAIEAKDQNTGEHLRRVQIYAREIGKNLGLSEPERLALQAASILHDVGKLAVPDYIISKPGKLTPEEFEKMKIHPVVGAEILDRIDFPYPVVPIVRAHHEKWDGSGYPFGLRGEQIPIGARILSAVDCFDALASDRQYRKALPLDQAMAMVRAEAGRSFDPQVVEILDRRYLELEDLSAADQSPALSKLSLDIRVERGDSPDAGFEAAMPGSATGIPSVGGPLLSVAAIAHQQGQELYELIRAAGDSLKISDAMALICARLNGLIPSDSIAVYFCEGDLLVPRYVWGENAKLLGSLRIPLGEGVCGWVAEQRRPILNGNPAVEPGLAKNLNGSRTLLSALAVPFETASRNFGVLALYRTEENGFSRDHLRALMTIRSKVALLIENSFSRSSGDAHQRGDPLTGLPNASELFLHLETEVTNCRSSESSLSVLVCDLDGFKQVNDLQGRLAGDRLLQRIASGFRNNCYEYDYLARRGGDEFVFVLPRLRNDAMDARISTLAGVVREATLEICGVDLVSVSIGTAIFPDDGDHPETLLAVADRRMHVYKQAREGVPAESVLETLSQMSDSLSNQHAPAAATEPPLITEILQ